ncbi:MAG TPA: HAD-IC family P-type ATPase [Longimicrobiales bacterium]|nr:HAD-IC family P-type ATPase [Longimicrobiales bacterium]
MNARPPDAADMASPRSPWHMLAVEEAKKLLGAGPSGLTEDEAARRLTEFGRNEVEDERVDPRWVLLLRQFRDPLVYILLIAAAVTIALRHLTDTAVILAVVILNAVIGLIQELRAREAILGLARLSAPRAEVVRDGHIRTIPSAELVPGDLVVLTSGSRIPADLRLESVRDLEVDESALTGESVPARKSVDALTAESLVPGDRKNIVFAGTVATRGRGRGLVVHTGLATELGRIALTIREVGTTATPLQEKTRRFGHQIGLAVVALSAIVVVAGLVRGMPPAEIFLAAVALAVSAIPEGLPVVLTVTLAIGVSRMARRNAIIRSLPAVETLGSTTVIGSDKTGTLTKNEMTVRAIWARGERYEVTGVGYALEGRVERGGQAADAQADHALRMTLLAGVVASEADAGTGGMDGSQGDPTEIALLVAAAKAGLSPADVRNEWRELDVLPFEPDRRFMATLVSGPGDTPYLFLKGAPEVIAQRCSRIATASGDEDLQPGEIEAAAASLSSQGLRVLAMAWQTTGATTIKEVELDDTFIFAGLQGMEDPVRPEAVQAVAAAREAGIRVVMLTGDHVATARAIGRQLGLGGQDTPALEGRQIETLSDDELQHAIGSVDVYARVAPEHKLRLVHLLKDRGETVAVTGDGVNDAPALRAAHLGVAMGRTGTDVAREAADMILADDNFATITAAVEEGRIVFSNIRKVTFFLLSTAVGEVITILAALFAGLPLPFVAAQILWINLVTNGLQDVALAFEPGEPGLLKRPPRPASEGILTPRLMRRLGAVGIVLAAGSLLAFLSTLDRTGDLDYARTVAMTQMVVFQFFHVFNCRSLDRSILAQSPFSNRFLFISFVAAASAHIAVLYVPALQLVFRTQPLDATAWATVVVVGTSVILGGELDKWWGRRSGHHLG